MPGATENDGATTLEVTDPATGHVVARVPALDADEVGRLVATARDAQPAWARTPVEARAERLRALRAELARDADHVVRTILSETGKTWEDAAFAELTYTLRALGFWAARGPGWLADERPRARGALLGRKLLVRHVPLGVVGVIAPWNYPLANALGDCIPALLAGNAVVLKPSELTPLTALLLAEAAGRAGIPPGVFVVAPGDGATGAAVIDAVDMVMFTGSTATGRKVAERAGRNLVPCSLELGGKDPMIVCADADLERAANVAVYYGLQNAGQTCLSVERVYVEATVYDAFVRKVVAKVRALRQGPPGDGPGRVEVGALASRGQLEVVDAHVRDAVARGARALTGGVADARDGLFFPPTVLVDVDHSMRCMREETFGPTLPIMRVADVDEAIAFANDSAYGLGASVMTATAERGEAIARRLEAGSVAVNDAMVFFAAMELPMGGWKQSGVGARHGVGGIRKYTRPQTVVGAGRLPRRDPHFFPYRPVVTRTALGVMRRAWGRSRT